MPLSQTTVAQACEALMWHLFQGLIIFAVVTS
jgi:hypothetical protein